MQKGFHYSEVSQYTVNDVNGDRCTVRMKDGSEAVISTSYLNNFCICANGYENEVKVGKQDKYWTELQVSKLKDNPDGVRPGDLKQEGILTIWNSIPVGSVFTVVFTKADKPKTKKAIQAEKESLVQKAQEIMFAQSALAMVEYVMANPVLDYTPGEERKLAGYKLAHKSVDGHYSVMDMDKNEERQVNAATISQLCYNGTLYKVE